MPEETKKLFIVGVQRSGTTLLRSVLHSHPDICAGYECAFYKQLSKTYRDGIAVPEDLDRFLNSLFAVRRFEHWKLTKEDIKAELLDSGATKKNLTYSELIENIGLCLRNTHKPDAHFIGFKNPNGVFHCDFIFNLFPEARILHIARDPRGVLGSEKKKAIKTGTYIPSQMIWTVAKRYKRMRAQHEIYKNDPRYIQLWYEDLINNFEPTLQQIMDFLDLDVHANQLSYHLQAKEKNFTPEAERWQHSKTLEAPDQSRINAYLDELTFFEISTLEQLCNKELHRFSLGENAGSKFTGILGIGKLLWDKGLAAIISKQATQRTSRMPM